MLRFARTIPRLGAYKKVVLRSFGSNNMALLMLLNAASGYAILAGAAKSDNARKSGVENGDGARVVDLAI